MDMNNKGQLIFVGIMIAVMVFITVVILIEPLKENITIARDNDHLNCTSTDISTGTKATCILVDWYLFYFVGTAMACGVAYITGRKLANQ